MCVFVACLKNSCALKKYLYSTPPLLSIYQKIWDLARSNSNSPSSLPKIQRARCIVNQIKAEMKEVRRADGGERRRRAPIGPMAKKVLAYSGMVPYLMMFFLRIIIIPLLFVW